LWNKLIILFTTTKFLLSCIPALDFSTELLYTERTL
jgi:hypothetical protein